MRFDKLELSTETLRELNDDELAVVAGGGVNITLTQTPACPSGATWFAQCVPPILESQHC